MTATEVLKKYWNYEAFRPGQEEVVNAIVAGKDTLALFPTGGGKSVCFQVPGLMLDGITLVVSPLIALMKDQVGALQKLEIPAISLHSGMSWNEMRLTMENALKGRYKFIYVSPERLISENFREYLPNLNISLLVIDEAHCISQWGYDFRPSYLRIAECRELLPKAKIAAFTASAPPIVQTDICNRLQFKNPFVFIAPFRRSNLHFYTTETENKTGLLVQALHRNPGTAIVFCDTRRDTEEISRYLNEKQIAADFYHAGLTAAIRSRKQDKWMRGQSRVMVCTNAFGMGVDKPDVRMVFHLAPPLFPEAYYQEAGRAGRDGKDSWCMLYYRKQDFFEMEERIRAAFPPIKELERVYNAVCNYFEIIVGNGMDQSFEFDLNAIAERYKMQPAKLYFAVANLETMGFWSLSDGFWSPSKMYFTADYSEVYDFKLRNPKFENLIDVLLRSYGGIFDGFVKINEKQIAHRLHIPEPDLQKMLKDLQRSGMLDYQAASDKPRILFTEPRSPYPQFKTNLLEALKNTRTKGMETMRAYLDEKECRSIFWEKYYGKSDLKPCGKCDICKQRKKAALSEGNLETWSSEIEKMLRNTALTRTELLAKFDTEHAYECREVLRWLMDNKQVLVDANHKLYWKE